MSRRIRVAKLGGSLLEWPALIPALRGWLEANQNLQTALVVGGGTAVDALRTASSAGEIDEATAHWQAIAVMGQHARRIHKLLPETSFADTLDGLRSSTGTVVLFDPLPFLQWNDQQDSPVPADWTVTSDSIAARLADVLSAEELVLLKSALPKSANVERASEYVDRYFQRAAARLEKIRFINLRDAGWAEVATSGASEYLSQQVAIGTSRLTSPAPPRLVR